MEHAAGRTSSDPALDTLLLPFAAAGLHWPSPSRVAFLRARPGSALPPGASQWHCEQGFKPSADALGRYGMAVSAELGEGDYALVLLLPPRQRQEARSLLARALHLAGPDGVVLAAMPNDEGARSAESDLERLAGPVQSISKNHCRSFWSLPVHRRIDQELLRAWRALDAPRSIADGRFVSRPGLFAWDRIDAASAMLAQCLPSDLSGAGADLGAGFGYLSAEVLARCPGVTRLDLFEAEARALELARVNLARVPPRTPSPALGFHWHDVADGIPGRYDFIVSNPPFHEGRAAQPDLGRAFIAAAAAALKPAGRLMLVANRHLPYEAALRHGFSAVRAIREEQGFKVIEATRSHG